VQDQSEGAQLPAFRRRRQGDLYDESKRRGTSYTTNQERGKGELSEWEILPATDPRGTLVKAFGDHIEDIK